MLKIEEDELKCENEGTQAVKPDTNLNTVNSPCKSTDNSVNIGKICQIAKHNLRLN